MHYSIFLSTTLAALAFASPVPEEIKLLNGESLIVSPATEKRSPERIMLLDGNWLTVSDADDHDELRKREDDHISSCGPKSGWMPIADHGMHLDEEMWGYQSTVEAFCSTASWGLGTDGQGTPVVVAAGKKISFTIKWQNQQDKLQDWQRGSRVGLKDDQPGHVEFEVNNKRESGDYTMNQEDCKAHLLKLSEEGSECYGPNNKDTKGGTWQMEDNKLTFHALPAADDEKNVPSHDELRI